MFWIGRPSTRIHHPSIHSTFIRCLTFIAQAFPLFYIRICIASTGMSSAQEQSHRSSGHKQHKRQRNHPRADEEEEGQPPRHMDGDGRKRETEAKKSRLDCRDERNSSSSSRHRRREGDGQRWQQQGQGSSRQMDRDESSNYRRKWPPRGEEEAGLGRRVVEEDGGRDSNQTEQQHQTCHSWENSRVRKHAEMIQERKLLWKGAGKQGSGSAGEEGEGQGQGRRRDTGGGGKQPAAGAVGSNSEKKLETKWTSMIAATAKDTQQMDKFQRLMGLKKAGIGTAGGYAQQQPSSEEGAKVGLEGGGGEAAVLPTTTALSPEELERERARQLEMQRGLDKQFEMARHAHHSARGRGLGSF